MASWARDLLHAEGCMLAEQRHGLRSLPPIDKAPACRNLPVGVSTVDRCWVRCRIVGFLCELFGGTMTTAFDTWLAKQFDEGLVDIKFAVLGGKGVSVEVIQEEVLAAEAAIGCGLERPAPMATSMMPKHITEFVAAVH